MKTSTAYKKKQPERKIVSETIKTQRKSPARKCPILTRKLVLIDKLIQNLKWYYSEVLMLEHFYVIPGYSAGPVGMLPEPRLRDKIAHLGEIKERVLEDASEIQRAKDKIVILPYYTPSGKPGAQKDTRAINIDLFAIRNFYQALQSGRNTELTAHERNFDFVLLVLTDWLRDSITQSYRHTSFELYHDDSMRKARRNKAANEAKTKQSKTKAQSIKTWLQSKQNNRFFATWSRQEKARQFIHYVNASKDKTLLRIWGVKYDDESKKIPLNYNPKRFAERFLKQHDRKEDPYPD